jgi:hypothetical protein
MPKRDLKQAKKIILFLAVNNKIKNRLVNNKVNLVLTKVNLVLTKVNLVFKR